MGTAMDMHEQRVQGADEAREGLPASQADLAAQPSHADKKDAYDRADRYPDVPAGRRSKAEEEHARRGRMGDINAAVVGDGGGVDG